MSRLRALTLFVAGALAAWFVPLPDATVAAVEAPPGPTAASSPSEPISAAPPPVTTSDGPVLPELDCATERIARGRVEALARQLDEARAAFEHRYGEPSPAPADFDPVDAELRYRDLLDGYPGARWSAVDCTWYPCVGLVVTDASLASTEAAELLGAGTSARVVPLGTSGAPLGLVEIGFTEAPVHGARARWVRSLLARLREKHAGAIEATR